MKKTLLILSALLLTAVGASAQSSWTAPVLQSSTLATEGGKYYLFNTEAKQYACEGSYKWGTNAIFGDNGLLFTLASASTTDYDGTAVTAYTMTSSAGQFFYDGEYIYCDGSSKTDIYFVFTETEEGSKVYKIHGTYAAMDTYIGYDPEDVSATYGTHAVLPALAGTDGQGIEWELYAEDAEELYEALVILYNTLVHAESYGMNDENEAYKSAGETYLSSYATVDAVMEAVAALEVAMEGYASEEDPDDVTYAYITNPDFDSYSDTDGFIGWTNSGMTYQGTPHTNGDITISVYPEKWVASENSLTDAKISQTLADLPVGTYRLEADAIAVKQTSDSPEVTGVYLYASSPFTSMTSVSTGDGLPEHYAVSFKVAEEGTSVDIGFEVVSTNANWVAVDNFRLYYLSSEVTAELTDTPSDYNEGDEATLYGHKYNILSDNMVENHSFELGLTGWTNTLDFTTEITSEDFDLLSDDPQDGDVYLVGTKNGGSSATSSLGKAWAIEAGKTYYFSYWVKSQGTATNGGYLETSLGNEPGTEDVSLNTPTVTSEWQKIEVLFTNTNYKYVQVKFRWLNNQWGFDNFQLYQVEPAEDVLEGVSDDSEYTTGDEVTVDGKAYTVVGDNMFVNGGFNADMYGWTAAGYYVAADPDNFDVEEEGGFNEGAYLIASSGGTGNAKTPSQAIAVEEGKTYLFIGYTNGSVPTSKNMLYSSLFLMSDATTEVSEDNEPVPYVSLEWGAEAEGTSTSWTQTMAVFTAETAYAGVRLGWSGGSYDGFQLYEVEAVPETIEWEMTEAEWGTIILPFEADVPDGLTAYSCDEVSGDELVLTEATTLEANTPYIMAGAAATYEFTGVAVDAENGLTAGLLTGTYETMDCDALLDAAGTGTVYLLQNHTGENEEGVAFYQVIETESAGATLTANHCYLLVPSDVSPNALRLPGMATAIEAVESDVIANDAIYDLSGRRVSKAVKGVYIQNGKKVLVK